MEIKPLEHILRRNEMKAATGYCIARIYQLIAEGRFPKPIPLGDRAVGWLESDIVNWQQARIAERNTDPATQHILTQQQVNSIAKRGRYGDGGGLYLQVSAGGSKQWIFRYMISGRPRHMGLGSVRTFSLEEARERARLCRQKVADGIDPIDIRAAA